MKIRFLALFSFTVFCQPSYGQIVIATTDSVSLAQTIASTVFGGCVQISNIQWSGNANSFGLFSDENLATGIDSGLVMGTGHVSELAGNASTFSSSSLNSDGDVDLNSLASAATYDAAILEFDFVPVSDTIFASQFVFGSEEYPEWVNSGFNDVFAFWISGGPSSLPATNLALVPGTTDPITINTINENVNSSFYMNNSGSTDVTLDGLTTLIPLSYPVVMNEIYHFKIAIADAGDGSYDSGIFLKAQSFCGSFWLQSSQFIIQHQGGLTYQFENHSTRSSSYVWDFGDGSISTDENPIHTYASSSNYQVSLTAINDCQDTLSQQSLSAIPTGISTPEFLEYEVLLLNNQFSISYSASSSGRLRYDVINTLGQEVQSGQIGMTDKISMQIPSQIDSDGVYYFRLWVEDRPFVKKIIRL